ncbi:Uncharacterised protein [Klebsiella pneumoniae]|nr:Uncharacterised protein [Klebsiella pneumoniae]
MRLAGQFEEPFRIGHHVGRLRGIFQGFGHCAAHQFGGRAGQRFAVLRLAGFHCPDIDIRIVTDPQALTPQLNPAFMPDVTLPVKHARRNHHQGVEVRVCAAVTAAGDFRGAYPALNWSELFTVLQSLESRVHPAQRLAQLLDRAVAHGQGQKHPAGIGVIRHDTRQGLVETGLPHQGAPPLADRTVPDTAEMRLTQPQARFSGFFEGRPPKPQ